MIFIEACKTPLCNMFSFGNQNNEKKKRKIHQPYFSWFQFDEHLNRNSSLGIIITTAGGVDQV